MRQSLLFALLTLLLVCSCNDNKDIYLIEFKLTNCDHTPIYTVQEQGSALQFDTLLLEDDFLIYSGASDSLSALRIYLPSSTQPLCLFVENGARYELKGDGKLPQEIEVSGGKLNEELNRFNTTHSALLQSLYGGGALTIEEHDSLRLQLFEAIETHVAQHRSNPSSTLLIAQYLCDWRNPSWARDLYARLKPKAHFGSATEKIEHFLAQAYATVPPFEMPPFAESEISPSVGSEAEWREQPTIYLFWDYHDSYSQRICEVLDTLYSHYKPYGLAWGNIAVALDSTLFKPDSVNSTQHYLPLGWSSPIVDSLQLTQLPIILLQNDQGVVTTKNPSYPELVQWVEINTLHRRGVPNRAESAWWGVVSHTPRLNSLLRGTLYPPAKEHKAAKHKIPYRDTKYCPNYLGAMAEGYNFYNP